MGVSGAVFESAGKRTVHWVPGVYSRRNTVPGGTGTVSNNLVIMGPSVGGKPRTMIPVSDVTEAREMLVGGQLLEGVAHAFNGSNDFVPQQVYAFRVNGGTQASHFLMGGVDPILEVKSWDYGVHTNQLKILVQDGAAAGSKKITVSYKGDEATEDNILRRSFSVRYIGPGTSPTVTIKEDRVQLAAAGDLDGNHEFLWDDYETLEALVSRINDTGVFSAALLDERADAKTRDLDTTLAVAVGADAVFYSNLAAFAETLARMRYIGEVKIVSSDLFVVPENTHGFEYFAGGTAGTNTVEDWIDSLAALEDEDVQSIATPSTDPNVRVLISNHVTAMCQTEKRKERQGIVGVPLDMSIDDACTAARELNSEYMSVVPTDAAAGNPLTGASERIDAGMVACKIAGMEAAMGVATPLTNKAVKVNAFGRKYRTAELNKMIQSGLMPCGINEEGQLVIIRAMTTYQGDSLALNERSCVRAALFMDRDLRKAYSRRIGTSSEPSTSEIISVLQRKAKEWHVRGYITISDNGELVFNTKVRFDGDKTYLEYDKYIRAPNNFVFITSNNMIYSSAE